MSRLTGHCLWTITLCLMILPFRHSPQSQALNTEGQLKEDQYGFQGVKMAAQSMGAWLLISLPCMWRTTSTVAVPVEGTVEARSGHSGVFKDMSTALSRIRILVWDNSFVVITVDQIQMFLPVSSSHRSYALSPFSLLLTRAGPSVQGWGTCKTHVMGLTLIDLKDLYKETVHGVSVYTLY